MFKPLFAFIGSRYTRSPRKNHFISFISLTSVIGVALGVSVLITVLSVMNGFSHESRSAILTGTPHITVGKMGGPLTKWADLVNTVKTQPGVVGAAPITVGKGMLSNSETQTNQGVYLKGIDPVQIQAVYP